MVTQVEQRLSGIHNCKSLEDSCFLRCFFVDLTAQGAMLSGSLFVACEFVQADFYWCHAYNARFVDCAFDACDLRGSFDSATFVRCRFVRCKVGDNELGGKTGWENTTAVECTVVGDPLPVIQTGNP